jgi:membrane-associated phospholipid phosphatase
MHWILLGVGGAIVALLVAYLFPSLIPAQSAATKL